MPDVILSTPISNDAQFWAFIAVAVLTLVVCAINIFLENKQLKKLEDFLNDAEV